MNSADTQKKLNNDADPEMARILEDMLEADQTITARAVARRHPGIGHASSITRIPVRSELLARYQELQNQFREWQHRMPKRSRQQIATQLAQKDVRISELERQVEILCISHVAMIRAVGEQGGTSKWLKLYADYRPVRDELNRLGVLPQADVKQFRLPQPPGAKDENS
jgi:hypothetical protein